MKKLLVVVFLWPALLWAGERFFPSGLFNDLVDKESAGARLSQAEATAAFLQRYYGALSPSYEWRQVNSFVDHTHVHNLYQLYYQGRKVVDQFLRLHFNRQGWMEYATSGWQAPFFLPPMPPHSDFAPLETSWRQDLVQKYGRFNGTIQSVPVVYLDSLQGAVAGVEVHLDAWKLPLGPGRYLDLHRHFIADEKSGRILSERKVVRNLRPAPPMVDTYLVSPPWTTSSPAASGGDAGGPVPRALNELTDPTTLNGKWVYVRREENTTTPALVDIDQAHEFKNDAGWSDLSADPATDYNFTCTGSTLGCPNQGFDGHNVYYQLDTYRAKVDTYFTQLGVAPAFPVVPLPVIINSLSVVAGGDNNAAYVPQSCGTGMPKCLIFLHPNNLDCGAGPVPIFDLARESIVMVHEFQHYITDTIAGFVSGQDQDPAVVNVGDAVHEGYSDYFAASHVSFNAGTTVTNVLAYAFQNCPTVERDVAVLRVYGNGQAETDPHTAGLTWASGLWQLRTELGKDAVDMLAYKSLFFANPKTGFADVIESLVKADEALNAGANVGRIRQLFYDQLQFVGGNRISFTDPANHLAEMGFHSCAVDHAATPEAGGLASLLFLLWWQLTTRLGRWSGRRREAKR